MVRGYLVTKLLVGWMMTTKQPNRLIQIANYCRHSINIKAIRKISKQVNKWSKIIHADNRNSIIKTVRFEVPILCLRMESAPGRRHPEALLNRDLFDKYNIITIKKTVRLEDLTVIFRKLILILLSHSIELILHLKVLWMTINPIDHKISSLIGHAHAHF
jgi:hypothetical protein